MRRAATHKRKLRTPPRKCNSFMLYLRDRWNDEQRTAGGMRYRTLMYTAAKDWKLLNIAIKRVYQARSRAS
jgi:hypothetical protein